MDLLLKFFLPYVSALYGAASNIEQSLEGLGALSSNFITRNAQGMIIGSYWSPVEVAQSILGLLVLLAPPLLLLWCAAGYVVGRKKGVAIAILLACLPGILSVMGVWPSLSFFPDTFVIDGRGVLGSGWGMLPLVGLGMAIGWTCAIILCDLFSLGDRFWHIYDHLWVATAIFAGIFFVADSQVGDNNRELTEDGRTFQQASAFLLKQVEAYDRWCAQNNRLQSDSCKWASDVHQTLLNYSTQAAVINAEFGPKSIADVYLPFTRQADPERINVIRRELASYNDRQCPTKDLGNGMRQLARTSALCQQPPPTFCNAFPEPLDGVVDHDAMIKSSAVANECLIPTLIMLRQQQEKLLKKIKEGNTAKHYRWAFYIALAFAAGGKIAGSTAKVASFGQRDPKDGRRIIYLARRAASGAWRASKFFFDCASWLLRWMLSALYRIARALRAIAQGFRARQALRRAEP